MAKKEQEMEDASVPTEADESELRVYELAFHIDPELPSEEVKKVYQSIRERITAAGTLVAEGEPEKIAFAYTISRSEHAGRRDFTSAFFAWIAYETDGKGHESITSSTRADSRIVRLLDIRTSKEEAKHSAEIHEIFSKVEVPVEEETSDAELDAALKEAGVPAV